ncbi:hypothetical protein COB55_03030 [Candidatus Wolfebacteria bacterium]|nr:MAG: hypothetical protein COB55_03030 [Candidatus Wolfebacteria bacterium]
MIRCRFKANPEDYRPVNWPIKHPYWCTGYGDGSSIIVAYADDEDEIMKNWPDAEDLDSEERDEYAFTDRFKKPDWFTLKEKS